MYMVVASQLTNIATIRRCDVYLMFCSVFTIPLGTRKKGKALQQGVTIFISQLNDLNAEKSQPSGDLSPGHVQSRYTPREPHINRDGIPFFILPYLISVTSRGSKSIQLCSVYIATLVTTQLTSNWLASYAAAPCSFTETVNCQLSSQQYPIAIATCMQPAMHFHVSSCVSQATSLVHVDPCILFPSCSTIYTAEKQFYQLPSLIYKEFLASIQLQIACYQCFCCNFIPFSGELSLVEAINLLNCIVTERFLNAAACGFYITAAALPIAAAATGDPSV